MGYAVVMGDCPVVLDRELYAVADAAEESVCKTRRGRDKERKEEGRRKEDEGRRGQRYKNEPKAREKAQKSFSQQAALQGRDGQQSLADQ